MASSWLVSPDAWPVWACSTRATSASSAVHSAPTGVRTSTATTLVNAATATTPSPILPSEIDVTYTPSSGPNDGASSRRPAIAP